MEDKIKAIIDKVRPALQADGGDVEYIDYNDGIVTVRLKGACGTCPMATMTLKHGIEARVREAVPEVKSVEAI